MCRVQARASGRRVARPPFLSCKAGPTKWRPQAGVTEGVSPGVRVPLWREPVRRGGHVRPRPQPRRLAPSWSRCPRPPRIAATAASLAPETRTFTARVILPRASSRTPAILWPRRTTPAPPRRASVIASSARSLPAAMAFSIRPRLSGAYSLRNGFLKPALGQAAVDRQLAALEPVERHALARLLALDALARGLALARADAAPEPLGLEVRAGIVPDLVQLHRSVLHSTRCATRADHAAHGGRVLQLARATDLAEAETRSASRSAHPCGPARCGPG